MSVVSFYKGSGDSVLAYSQANDGAICFDAESRLIYLNGEPYGGGDIRMVTDVDVVVEESDEHYGDIKVTFSEGAPKYIKFPVTDLSALEESIRGLQESVEGLSEDVEALQSKDEELEGLVLDNAESISANADAIAALQEAVSGEEGLEARVSALEEAEPEEVDTDDYLGSDITVTGVTVGNLKDGDALTEDMSLRDIIKAMLVKEIDVVASKPSLKITAPKAASVEVGSTVSGTMSSSYTDGSFTGEEGYSYTLNAGCEEGEVVYKVNGSVVAGGVYSVVAGDSAITFDASVSYGANTNVPKTNVGKDSAVSIEAGEAKASQVKITPYRPYFYGALLADSAFETIDSAAIRSLTNSGKAANTTSWKLSVPKGAKQIIVASVKEIKSVTDDGVFGTELTDDFVKSSVNVNDAAGSNAKAYNVYVLEPAVAWDDDDTFTVTFKA